MLPINPTADTRFLCGKSVYLRPFEKKDLPNLYQWGNDPDIRSLTAEVNPMTPSGLEKFWEKVSNEPDRLWFTVSLYEGNRPVGEVELLRMLPAWRTTDLSIILGDKSAWRQGFGSKAINCYNSGVHVFLLRKSWFGHQQLNQSAHGLCLSPV